MKKILLIAIISLFNSTLYSQDVVSKLGGSVSGLFMNSDFGMLPGGSFMLENRLEFRNYNLELKNNLGVEFINNVKAKHASHYIAKFGTAIEYNFYRFGFINRFGKNWTPYVGLGFNVMYYKTSDFETINTHVDNVAKASGISFSAKGTFGIKYKLKSNIIIHGEVGADWSFSDDLDGRNIESDNVENNWPDHIGVITIGVSYLL